MAVGFYSDNFIKRTQTQTPKLFNPKKQEELELFRTYLDKNCDAEIISHYNSTISSELTSVIGKTNWWWCSVKEFCITTFTKTTQAELNKVKADTIKERSKYLFSKMEIVVSKIENEKLKKCCSSVTKSLHTFQESILIGKSDSDIALTQYIINRNGFKNIALDKLSKDDQLQFEKFVEIEKQILLLTDQGKSIFQLIQVSNLYKIFRTLNETNPYYNHLNGSDDPDDDPDKFNNFLKKYINSINNPYQETIDYFKYKFTDENGSFDLNKAFEFAGKIQDPQLQMDLASLLNAISNS